MEGMGGSSSGREDGNHAHSRGRELRSLIPPSLPLPPPFLLVCGIRYFILTLY